MQPTLSLIRREFSAYSSLIAYVVLTVFLIITGHLFYQTVLELTAVGPRGVEFPMRRLLGFGETETLQGVLEFLAFWLVFLIIPPLLTMRLLAEERSSGTLEMLLTAPVRDSQIVISKFVACFMFYLVMWLPTLLYLPLLLNVDLGARQMIIDPWPVVSTYLGLALVGAMFLSIGLFVSSLVRSQMVAAFVSLFLCLLFIVAGFWREMDIGNPLYQVLFFFTVPLHFDRNFCRGLVDTRQLVLYASVTLFCLFLTVRSLEGRRRR